MTPREVEMTPRTKRILALALFIGLALPLVFVPMASVDLQKQQALHRRGVTLYGEVVGLHLRAGPIFRVEYEYEPKELGRILGPRPRGVDFAPVAEFAGLHVGQFIQIRYDPDNPEYSAIEGGFLERRPVESMTWIYLAALPFLAAALAFPALYARAYQRERRLLRWGLLAPAVILPARGTSRVSYQFTDQSGAAITSAQDRTTIQAGAVTTPTVLYDPENSADNQLLPLRFVQPR